MKIAIFHDYLDCIGGGERLVLTLARALNADVITTDFNRDYVKKLGFEDVNVISMGETVKIPPLKQIVASVMFRYCNFSNRYDFFIISGNWALFAAKRHRPNLAYCHTPVREFYDLYQDLTDKLSFPANLILRVWVFFHRMFIERSIRDVNKFIANSKNVQKRIMRYYHRESEIVHPFVDTKKFKFRSNGDFWLSVNRLYPAKRVGLQIEAFKRLPEERLVIVGSYAKGDHAKRYAKKLLRDLPQNISIVQSIPDSELILLYSKCKGFIATAKDEDFGMSVLEAMASGKPVVAVNEGGYKETVVDGVNGRLTDASASQLVEAVKSISENPKRYKKNCKNRAKEFDVSIFVKKIRDEIAKQGRTAGY